MKNLWRVRASRWLNAKLGGKPHLMLSSRAYIEDRKQIEWFINLCFYVLRKEKNHCQNSLYIDILMERVMKNCGLCHHTDDLFPFEVVLVVGEERHECGELCYRCVRYLQFVVSKFERIEMQSLPVNQGEQ